MEPKRKTPPADIEAPDQGAFATVTMARVYTAQGYHAKAAAIYRHLLARDPDRRDLAEALASAEAVLRRSGHDRLVALFAEWLELAEGYRRINGLRRLLPTDTAGPARDRRKRAKGSG